MPAIADNFALKLDLTDVRRKMELLGVRISSNALRRALLAGAAIIRDDARRRVRKRTGALERSIIAETDRKGSSREQLVANVKIASKAFTVNKRGKAKAVSSKVQKARGKAKARGELYPRAYAHLVEFGTRPHRTGKGSSLGDRKQRGRSHPGARPQPFMRPAFDTKGEEAKKLIEKGIRQQLEVEVSKMARSTIRSKTA